MSKRRLAIHVSRRKFVRWREPIDVLTVIEPPAIEAAREVVGPWRPFLHQEPDLLQFNSGNSFVSGLTTPMRTDTIRSEVLRLIRQTPYRAFALNLENGDRIILEHPENIAFDPPNNGSSGSNDFYVIADNLRIFSTFDAVSSVALVDVGG